MRFMTNKRAAGLLLIGLLGFLVGLHGRPDAPGSLYAFASYENYATLRQLREASDRVVRGTVDGNGTTFLDFGARLEGDVTGDEVAVPMRIYPVHVSYPKTGDHAQETVHVAVTDFEQVLNAGDAVLFGGDDVFLFLEVIDRRVFAIDELVVDLFYVVVGGQQGVFRLSSSTGMWEQSRELHETPLEGEESIPSGLFASQDEIERVATP